MRALASFVAGRRTKWVVLALWIVAFAALMPLGAKLADETQDDTASFLPESAESTEVVEHPRRRVPRGETTQGLIVYQRDGGLTEADKRKIAADAEALEALPDEELPLTAPPMVPFGRARPPDLVSPTATSPTRCSSVPTTSRRRPTGARTSATLTGEEADGLRILLTGDLGFSADAEEVFGELDTKLLLATVLLVLVLLGAIYRSVLVALTPLIVVFLAYTVAHGFIYLYAKSGATVSSNGDVDPDRAHVRGRDRLLPAAGLALPRGAAPDRGQARRDGARACSRTGPAILASGLTVSLAMLVLAARRRAATRRRSARWRRSASPARWSPG